MATEKYVVRIGGHNATAGNTCWVVRLSDDKAEHVFVQASATRFDTADDAREMVRVMLARGDTWADKARPVRLVGTRTIKRGQTP